MEATNKLTPRERELIEEAFRRHHNALIALAEQPGIGVPRISRETMNEFSSAVAKVRRLING